MLLCKHTIHVSEAVLPFQSPPLPYLTTALGSGLMACSLFARSTQRSAGTFVFPFLGVGVCVGRGGVW